MKRTSRCFAVFLPLFMIALSACSGHSDPGELSGAAPRANKAAPEPGATPCSDQPQTISIVAGAAGKGNQAYNPNPVSVKPGVKVTWVNNDLIDHSATSDTDVFDSETMEPGQSFEFTFSVPGIYPYHCTIHGVQSMSGTIEVCVSPTQSATPSPTPSSTPVTTPSPTPVPSPSASPSPDPSPTPSPSPTP